MKKTKKKFMTLFIDIETSPNIVLSWRIGNKVSLTHNNILEERRIICISYKWKGDKKVHTVSWDKDQCDKKLLEEISKVIDGADEIVGHNGDRYDMKFINGRLAFHNLPPLSSVQTTDTLRQSREVFYLNSQKLDYLGQFFDLGKKMETGGYGLWKDVFIKKSAKALKKMIKYCERDVILLEKIYDHIIRYNPNVHKGRAFGNGTTACPACGSEKTHSHGTRVGKGGLVYKRHKCTKCAHVFKGKRVKNPNKCKGCESLNTELVGTRTTNKGGYYRQYECKSCGRDFEGKRNEG